MQAVLTHWGILSTTLAHEVVERAKADTMQAFSEVDPDGDIRLTAQEFIVWCTDHL